MRLQLTRVLALLALSLVGCRDDERFAQPPELDRAVFDAEVYPLLLRDCGFPACHGDRDRFFRVFGPGRTRLSADTSLYEPATSAEREATFDRARSMLAAVPDPTQSLLLRKPLEEQSGGGAHLGLDALGRNVYGSTEDPAWRVLAAWAGVPLEGLDAGTTADAGDVGPADATVSDDGATDTGAVLDAGAGEDAP
jgi:hypothetical protein